MKNEIERSGGEIERASNGKRVCTSRDELLQALAPIFATFPEINKMSNETFNAYYMMLSDIDPDRLAQAVLDACQDHEYPRDLITPAAIRKHLPEKREPGPRSESENNYILPEPPHGGFKMFRLSAEEDKRQRMELLRMTSKWGNKYA